MNTVRAAICSPSIVESLFNSLAGDWDFQRNISPGGTVKGTCAFTPDGENRLHYLESGVLTLQNGEALGATRAFTYCLEPQAITVYFADGANKGSLFHELGFSSESYPIVSEAAHLCGNDHYQIKYQFMSRDLFEIEYVVTGPQKDYLSHTRFKKIHNQ